MKSSDLDIIRKNLHPQEMSHYMVIWGNTTIVSFGSKRVSGTVPSSRVDRELIVSQVHTSTKCIPIVYKSWTQKWLNKGR